MIQTDENNYYILQKNTKLFLLFNEQRYEALHDKSKQIIFLKPKEIREELNSFNDFLARALPKKISWIRPTHYQLCWSTMGQFHQT